MSTQQTNNINALKSSIFGLKKETGGAGPMSPSKRAGGAPDDNGAMDESVGTRIRLHVSKVGKNANILEALRMHDASNTPVTVRCKNALAFKLKTYIEAEADSDGHLTIAEEKRWLRFQR